MRRSPGEGTYKRLPSGKWRAALGGGTARVYGPAMPTRAEAMAALRQMLAQQRREEEAPPAPPSLSASATTKAETPGLSPTTAAGWRWLASHLARDPLGLMTPAEVDAADIAAYAERQTVRPRTVRNRLTMILQLMREAGHPIEARIAGGRRDKRPRILTPEEESRLLASVAGSGDVEAMVRLALQCGLRRSEIAGLRHEDRDGDGIAIRRAVVRAPGGTAAKGTKTPRGENWVPLPADGSLDWIGSGDGYVLGGDRPVSPVVLWERWRRAAAAAGLAGVGLHDLRRTYGMRLLETGTDVRTAAEMMRHDPKMLLDLYTASRRDLKRAAARRLSEPRGGTGGGTDAPADCA